MAYFGKALLIFVARARCGWRPAAPASSRWGRTGSDPYPMTARDAPTPAIPERAANPAPATMVPAVMGRRAVPVSPAVLRPVRLRSIRKGRDDVVQGRIRRRCRSGGVPRRQACHEPGPRHEHSKQKRSSVHNRDSPRSLWIDDTRRMNVVEASFTGLAMWSVRRRGAVQRLRCLRMRGDLFRKR